MELLVLLKLVSELSFYLMFSTFFGALFGLETTLLIPMVILALSGFFCWILRNKRLPIRLLPLLAILPCCFFTKTIAGYIVLLPPAVYISFISVKKYFACERGMFLGILRRGTLLGCILCIVSLFLPVPEISASGVLTYLLIFILTGILLSRMLRHDEASLSSKKLKLINLVSLISICLIGWFFSTSVFLGAAGAFASIIYRYLISPILLGVIKLISYPVSGIGSLLDNIDLKDNALDSFGKKLDAESIGLEGSEAGSVAGQYILYILLALVILGFLIVAFFVFRKLIAGRFKEDTGEKPYFEDILNTKKGRKTPKLSGNRSKIREYYRRFLLMCRKRGIEILPGHSSKDIASMARPSFGETPGELRDVYIRARYDDRSEIGHSEVQMARDLYGKMKEKK